MNMKYLGEQFDIHAGGIDHISIHHTNEIAQSEAATKIKPWVAYWLHNEFLVLGSFKVSKSSGSFVTLQNLVDEGFDPLDYRYFLLGGHYRSQLQFSMEGLQGAKNSRKSLTDKVRALAEKSAFSPENDNTEPQITRCIEAFNAAIEDDLNTPRALAELWGLLREGPTTQAVLAAIFDMDRVLGLGLEEICKNNVDPEFVREIEELIAKRAEAKKAKDFLAADNIRQSLKERGIILEDGPGGTSWKHDMAVSEK
jgi:cysteinyl-tRNA synthetase